MSGKTDLRKLFHVLQGELLSKLHGGRVVVSHPTIKGHAAELNWQAALGLLPSRYEVTANAFVVDSEGNQSQEIDLVIHDRHFSPLLFNRDGIRYIPAESAYAVLEVKQDLSKATLAYASQKAHSVRKLVRRNDPFAARPFGDGYPRIVAGIVCLTSTWTSPFGEALNRVLGELHETSSVDIGCALQKGAFDAVYAESGRLVRLEAGPPDGSLVFFFLRLLTRLEGLGTLPPMNYRAYEKCLWE